MSRKLVINRKHIAGAIIGIVIPLIIIPIVVGILAWIDKTRTFDYLWSEFLRSTLKQSRILSLAVIPNVAVFYFFLNRERYDLAKGIIVGSACFLPFIIYANFFA